MTWYNDIMIEKETKINQGKIKKHKEEKDNEWRECKMDGNKRKMSIR